MSGCINYWRITGDKIILTDLYNAARKNLEYMQSCTTDDGLTDKAGWVFIDWGYVRNSGPVDIGFNLHYFAALRDMEQWSRVLGKMNTPSCTDSKPTIFNVLYRHGTMG